MNIFFFKHIIVQDNKEGLGGLKDCISRLDKSYDAKSQSLRREHEMTSMKETEFFDTFLTRITEVVVRSIHMVIRLTRKLWW